VIPTVITQILNGVKQIKLGNLEPTRDMTFVYDTCAAFLEIYRSEQLFGQVTNVGMNSEISIGELAQKIMNLMEVEIPIIQEFQRVRPISSEVDRLDCNNQKLLDHTNWKPLFDLVKGLKQTMIWFRQKVLSNKSDRYRV
jgi:dTDP-glucose 4,6-dehydratase